MTKKDYLKKLLSVLPDEVFLPRQDLLYLLDHQRVDRSLLDTLFSIFTAYVTSVTSVLTKQKIQNSLNVLQKLKTIEIEDQLQDQKDIQELDSLLMQI